VSFEVAAAIDCKSSPKNTDIELTDPAAAAAAAAVVPDMESSTFAASPSSPRVSEAAVGVV
jgi:hypothetical protein